jgi:hypothetical protein
MVINMLVLGLLQIATIYATTFQQFLAVRSLFGLFMGGVYGNAIAMALENAPVEVWTADNVMLDLKLTNCRLEVLCRASCNKDTQWDMFSRLARIWASVAPSKAGRPSLVRKTGYCDETCANAAFSTYQSCPPPR